MQNLKIIRVKKGVTQFRIAQELGIPENKLCKIETGRRSASPEEILSIARILKVSVEDLMGFDMEIER